MSLARSSPSYGTQPYPTALLDIYRSIGLRELPSLRAHRPSAFGTENVTEKADLARQVLDNTTATR